MLCEMPLLITTKLKDRRGGHLALFLSPGIGWTFILFLKLWGGGMDRYVRTHICILYHGSPSCLGGRRYTFVDLNRRKVLRSSLVGGEGGAAARWISSWLHPTKKHTIACETGK